MAERKLPVVIVALSDGTPRAVYKRGRLPKTLDAFCEYVEYVPRDTIEPKRPLQWRPLPELTGESRYILVANTEHVASRIRYNSRASVSIEQLCLQQEGYEPTHFCELPELDSNETEPARPLQCRECRHFDNLVPGAICWKPGGLGVPKQDGTSSCSYAEPREGEGENG